MKMLTESQLKMLKFIKRRGAIPPPASKEYDVMVAHGEDRKFLRRMGCIDLDTNRITDFGAAALTMRSFRPKSVDDIEIDRQQLWNYCKRVAVASKYRARKLRVPHNIDANLIDDLLISQNYQCAVSGIVLMSPTEQGPFSPTLDRIDPALGYVAGNVRVVCQIVNMAMSSWGLEPVRKLLFAMVENGKLDAPPCARPRA